MVNNRIHEFECRSIEFTQSEQEKEQTEKKNEQSFRDPGNNSKRASSGITGVLEGEETEWD